MLLSADKNFQAVTITLIKESTLMMNEKKSQHNERKEISEK